MTMTKESKGLNQLSATAYQAPSSGTGYPRKKAENYDAQNKADDL